MIKKTRPPVALEPQFANLDADAVALEQAIQNTNGLPPDLSEEALLSLCTATREAVRADAPDRPVLFQALHEQLVLMRKAIPREAEETQDGPSYLQLRNALNELTTEVYDCLLAQDVEPDPITRDDPRLGPPTAETADIRAAATDLPHQANEAIDHIGVTIGPDGGTLNLKATKVINSGKVSARIIKVAIDQDGTLAKRLGELGAVLNAIPLKLTGSLDDLDLSVTLEGSALGTFIETAKTLGTQCIRYVRTKLPATSSAESADPVAQLRLVESYLNTGDVDRAWKAARTLVANPGHEESVSAFELRLTGRLCEDITPLALLVSLKSLDLSGSRVSDLSALSGLTDLQSLDIGFVLVRDLSALSRLVNLQFLGLFGTQITDVSVLSGLLNLQSLGLTGTRITDVSALSGLVNLQSLRLTGTQITDVSALSGLVNLQELSLRQTPISDVSAFSELVNLQSLDLSLTQVRDVSALSGLEHLTDLQLPYGVEDNRTWKPEPKG